MSSSENGVIETLEVPKKTGFKNPIFIAAAVVFVILGIVFGFPRLREYQFQAIKKSADEAYRNSQYDQARAKYLKALEMKPKDIFLVSRLGDISYATRDFKNAMGYYKMAVSMEPDKPRHHFNLGLTYHGMGEVEKSEDEFWTAYDLNHHYPNVVKQLVNILWMKGEKEKAIQLLEDHFKEDTVYQDPLLMRKLGEYYRDLNRNKKAVAILEKAMENKNTDEKVYALLYGIYREQDKPEQVKRVLEKYITDYPKKMKPYVAAAAYYEDMKDYTRAEEILKKARENLGNHLHSYFALSDFYRRRERFKEASGIMEEALSLSPNSYQVYFTLGLINYDAKDYKAAEKFFKRSISIRANDPATFNMLAWMYLVSPSDTGFYKPAEALKMAKRAVSIAPDESAFTDTLARAYLARERYDESIMKYKENLNRGRTLGYTYYGLAVNYFRLGRDKQAREYLDKALKFGFDDTGLIQHDLDIPEIRDNKKIQELMRSRDKT